LCDDSKSIEGTRHEYIFDKLLNSDQILVPYQDDTYNFILGFDFRPCNHNHNQNRNVIIHVLNLSQSVLTGVIELSKSEIDDKTNELINGMIKIFKDVKRRANFKYTILTSNLFENIEKEVKDKNNRKKILEQITSTNLKHFKNKEEHQQDYEEESNILNALLCIMIIGFTFDYDSFIDPIFYNAVDIPRYCQKFYLLLALYCIDGKACYDINDKDSIVDDFYDNDNNDYKSIVSDVIDTEKNNIIDKTNNKRPFSQQATIQEDKSDKRTKLVFNNY